jgi:hypothetical protein
LALDFARAIAGLARKTDCYALPRAPKDRAERPAANQRDALHLVIEERAGCNLGHEASSSTFAMKFL